MAAPLSYFHKVHLNEWITDKGVCRAAPCFAGSANYYPGSLAWIIIYLNIIKKKKNFKHIKNKKKKKKKKKKKEKKKKKKNGASS